MKRNWGVPSVTTGRAVGGNQPGRSHIAHDTQRELDNIIQLAARSSPARLNSRSKEVEPFIHPFELGSRSLILFVVLLPIAIVSGLVIGYAALAPEPIQYQSSVETYRFKGH